MNDPHVEALIYRVEHGATVDYDNVRALSHEEPAFRVAITGVGVRIELQEHCATVEAARTLVEPFLHAWELDASLRRKPGELTFRFVRAEVVDRAPTPGVIVTDSAMPLSITGYAVGLHESLSEYPKPPDDLAIDESVENMHYRYLDYHNGNLYLTVAAYYCLTTLYHVAERSGRARATRSKPLASKHFGISMGVLDEIARLSSTKGGRLGRKAAAIVPLTPFEHVWLEAALKMMIRRAAQVARDAAVAQNEITLSDLPKK